jgi:hypothetical protein
MLKMIAVNLVAVFCAIACASSEALTDHSVAPAEQTVESEMRQLGQNCSDTLVRVDVETLWYCGSLTQQTVDQILANWTPRTRKLIISSEGGNPSAAIRLVNGLRPFNPILQVRLVCLSGCAHFLFMAFDEVIVEEGAVVAYHHTSTQNFLTYGDRVDEEQRAILARQSMDELAFYDELGIDPRFLLWPGMMTGIICVGPSAGEGSEWAVVTRVGWVVMARETVDSLRRTPVQGWWPLNSEDIRRSFDRIGGQGLTFAYNGRMPSGGTFDEMAGYLHRRRTCSGTLPG